MLVGAVVLLGLAVLQSLAPDTGGGGPVGQPRSDVRLVGCTDTSFGSPKALLRVHNSTSRQADYFVTVVFEQDGVQKGSGFASVVDLNPGQDADTDAVGFGVDASSGSGWQCRISDVRRL